MQSSNHAHVINLSQYELSTIEKDVLCKGIDFGVPPRVNEAAVRAEFELLYNKLIFAQPVATTLADTCRIDLAEIAKRYSCAVPDTREFYLQREHLKAPRDLCKNPDIVITRPDKGRAVVVLSKQQYLDKMGSFLADE